MCTLPWPFFKIKPLINGGVEGIHQKGYMGLQQAALKNRALSTGLKETINNNKFYQIHLFLTILF